MAQEDFFVGVYDPIDVRRNLLEGSKEVVKSLQSYDKLEQIRNKKLAYFKEMRIVMSELDLLVGNLKTKLPKSNLRKAVDRPHPESSTTSFVGELAKLEEQLKTVEKELSTFK